MELDYELAMLYEAIQENNEKQNTKAWNGWKKSDRNY